VGASNEQSNMTLIDLICETLEAISPASTNPAMQAASVLRYQDVKQFVPDRPGHDRRYATDAEKIRRELGWTPRYTFADGLRATVQWYVDHPLSFWSRQSGPRPRAARPRRDEALGNPMTFTATEIPGVIIIDPDVYRDEGGYFLETFHATKYRSGGLPGPFVQDNHSSSVRNALRGLHMQLRKPQGKLVRAVEGRIWILVR
jgi:hypothetical protein